MDSNKTVTATFTEIPEYFLFVNLVGSGSVTYNGTGVYDPGDVVEILATPAVDWEFDGWSGDLTGMANPDTILMDSNKTVTATFTEIPEYFLFVNLVGSGSVTYNGTGVYDPGDVVEILATPAVDWEFDGWSGDLTGMANPDTILMDSNKSVTCTFTQNIPIIETCDATGLKKDTFGIGMDVYINGTSFGKDTVYSLYLVEDQAIWSDGMAIPARVSGTATTVTSDAQGNIPPTLTWTGSLIPGKYDVVVDVNDNGIYDAGIDALDDSDIEITAGLFIIPEIALGTISAILCMFAALAYFSYKSRKQK